MDKGMDFQPLICIVGCEYDLFFILSLLRIVNRSGGIVFLPAAWSPAECFFFPKLIDQDYSLPVLPESGGVRWNRKRF
jgi:hypothetical protein